MNLLHNNNLFSLLEDANNSRPDSIFFFYENKTVTYHDAFINTQKLANIFKAYGVKKGNRVILSLGNIPQFIYSYLALAQLGAISVLVNSEAKRFELKYIIDETEPGLVIIEKNRVDSIKINNSFYYDENKIILADGQINFVNFDLEKEKQVLTYEKLAKDDTVSIIYSSAMEGLPLGAMLTHNSIFEIITAMRQFKKEEDIHLSVLPIFHSFGLTTTFLLPLYLKHPFYLISQFNLKKIINLLMEKKITVFICVPIIFEFLSIFLPKGTRLQNLRVCISGGEAVSIKLQEKLFNKFGIVLRQGYGLTEASPIVTWNNMNVKNVFGSVGVVMPWNKVKIINNSTETENKKEGEIIVKGVNVMKGYYNKKEDTDRTIINGWLHTGDIGYFDENGYLFITGKQKNMIIYSGFNVYPKEVERILRNHPSINGAKISVRNSSKDKMNPRESLEAIIYTADEALDSDSIKKWCKDNISKYKIPKKIIIQKTTIEK